MKKIILSSMLFAAAAMAFISCQKSETAPELKPVTLTFTSANPDTKTEYNGETIVWSAGDVIRMACKANGVWQEQNGDVAEGGNARLYTVTIAEQESYETGTFVLHSYYANATPGPYEFYTIYPSSAKSSTAFTAPLAEITVQAKQNSSAETFDKAADILWGKSAMTYNELPTEIPLLWERKVAHAYITLDNIKGITTGEEVKSVKLTAQEGAALVGVYNLNMVTGEFSAKTPSNSLEVICSNVNADANGDASFWACINPCTITSLDIEVTTDKATYTISKTGLSLKFLQNRRNLLSINMSSAERKSPTFEGYTRISTLDQIVDGEYIITAKDTDGTYYAAKDVILTDGSTKNSFESIELSLNPNNNILSAPAGAVVPTFNIVRIDNQVTIQHTDGNYLSNPSGTALVWSEEPYQWNIYCDDTNKIPYIVQSSAQPKRALKYDNNAKTFKGYNITGAASQYKNLTLFKKN